MGNISIVTDSTADIPVELVEALGITVIPLTIHHRDKMYLDRVDLTNEEFYDILRETDKLPTTSQPAPTEFISTYQALHDQGAETIFSIHLSGQLSGTVNGARMAAQTLGAHYDIRVFDSLSATLGLGLLVTIAARQSQAGKSADDISEFLVQAIQKLKIYFLLDSLDNLEKGGRIGRASYLVGSILNIKPLLVLSNGEISVHKKIRGNKGNRALNELARSALNEIDANRPLYANIGYNNNRASADALVSLLEKDLAADELAYFQVGSVVSTHIGLGAVGIAFFQL